jgi:hypothetical protein
MTTRPVVFLNYSQVQTGNVGGQRLSRAYRLACDFLRCSIIDRTGQLEPCFPQRVLDPIPGLQPIDLSFAEICHQRANHLVELAAREGRDICVLWSGGIDSTVALIALGEAAREKNLQDRIVVVLSMDSVQENPRFFLREVVAHYRIRYVSYPLPSSLDSAAINVTGEHGDQLFGSHLLDSYVRRGLGHVPYADILPLIIFERLGVRRGALGIPKYLAPVIAASPVPVRTLIDYFWWLNFTLKWQEVSLRLPAWSGDRARAINSSLHHFYRTPHFQLWSMQEGRKLQPAVWADYKRPAKQFILDATGDRQYFVSKEKEDSLRNVLRPADESWRNCVVMYDDFQPQYRELDT